MNRSIICTLFEGDYHLGLGALVNSLYARGYRGELYAGFRGELPPWCSAGQREGAEGWRFDAAEGLTLHFIPLSTSDHLNNYKPTFLLRLIEERCPETENFFFFDPDIVVRAEWDFFARWVTRGIALCEDVNNYMPRHHPVRQAWKEYAEERGLTIRQEPDKYYNAGFFALHRDHRSFLEKWQQLFACRAREGVPLDEFVISDFVYPYLGLDQDLMNLALMLVEHPITAVGPEGMGFRPGGYVMAHAAGEIKSWRKHFIREAIKGRAPTAMDKEFVRHTQTPIRICSSPHLGWKRLRVTVGSAIGRFYRRGGS